MQFINASDKNNKDIYEGDIVLWHNPQPFNDEYAEVKRVIGYNPRSMGYKLYLRPEEVGKAAGEDFFAEDVEVIGHIYDYENEAVKYFTAKQ